jgi:hypothetical protein
MRSRPISLSAISVKRAMGMSPIDGQPAKPHPVTLTACFDPTS